MNKTQYYIAICHTTASHPTPIRMAMSLPPENELPPLEGSPSPIPGELMRLKHTRQMTDYLRGSMNSPRYKDSQEWTLTILVCGGFLNNFLTD